MSGTVECVATEGGGGVRVPSAPASDDVADAPELIVESYQRVARVCLFSSG